MNNYISELLNRIGAEGRFDLLEKWLYGQRALIANYNNGPRYESRNVFINYIVDGLHSDFNRQVKDNLAIIDAPALEQFETRYAELLTSVK